MSMSPIVRMIPWVVTSVRVSAAAGVASAVEPRARVARTMSAVRIGAFLCLMGGS